MRGEKAFTIIAGKGFQMAVGDRVISVMCGEGNYCENRFTQPLEDGWISSDDAEMVVCNREGGEIIYNKQYTGADAAGWQSGEQVAALISQLYEESQSRQREEYEAAPTISLLSSRQRAEARNTEDKTRPMNITGTRIACDNLSYIP